MIAEKSVNCSLLSLPSTPGVELPTCGPMESLALMYILREQGDMVTQVLLTAVPALQPQGWSSPPQAL